MFSKKTAMPSSDRSAARQGRADAGAAGAPCERRPARAAVSSRSRNGDVRSRLLLGCGEEVLGPEGGLHDRGRIRGRVHARTRPIARSAAGRRDTTRRCSSCSTRSRSRTAELLKVFWESHDPTQGMRQGNDVGTQYRSGIYYYGDAQREAAERSRDAFQQQLRAAGYGAHHDRDHPCAGVLLRGGLPPAVPVEESGRLLRPRRHRRHLSGRRRSALEITPNCQTPNAKLDLLWSLRFGVWS